MSRPKDAPNVLVIPDGDRRWAREHNQDYDTTYDLTAERMLDITTWLGNLGAQEVWVSITRPFNSQRDSSELDAIFRATTCIHDMGDLQGRPINISADGDLTGVPEETKGML